MKLRKVLRAVGLSRPTSARLPLAGTRRVAAAARSAAEALERRMLMTVTPVNPSDDAYVRDGTANSQTEFGVTDDQKLQVESYIAPGFNRDAYLKFSVAAAQGATLNSATLRFRAVAVDNTGTGAALAVSAFRFVTPGAAWGESTINWDNRPALSGWSSVANALGTVNVSPTAAAWYTMDLKAFVAAELAAGRTNVSFGLHGVASTDKHANIDSAESANKPELVLDYTPATAQQPVTVPPSDDAYTYQFEPNTAFGATTGGGQPNALRVKYSPTEYNRHAYLKFPVSQFAAAGVTAAKLRLYGWSRLYDTDQPTTTTINVSSRPTLDTAWAESTVTWNTRPGLSGTAGPALAVGGTDEKWHEWDVTSLVAAAVSAGKASVTLALTTATNEQAMARFRSKEASGGYGPQLVVTPAAAPANAQPTQPTLPDAPDFNDDGNAATLTAAATDDGGAANLRYTWSPVGTQPGTVTFSPNGTTAGGATVATFGAAGTYHLQVFATDAADAASPAKAFSVTVAQRVTTLVIGPGTASLGNAHVAQFNTYAADQFGHSVGTGPLTWSIDTGGAGGTITNTGLYTAPAAGGGTAIVRAAADGLQATATVTVLDTRPTDLTAVAVSASQIDLAWADNTTNEQAYVVEYQAAGQTGWASYPDTLAGATTLAATGLQAATTYTFRVSARHATGLSTASDPASATTSQVPVGDAPTNATVALASASEAAIAWTPPASPGLLGFNVYASVNGGPYAFHDMAPANATGCRYFSAEPVAVSFRVSATYATVESALVDVTPAGGGSSTVTVAASTPTVVSNLHATAAAYTDGVPLSWDPAPDATGYAVEWSNGDGEWMTVAEQPATGPGGETSYTDEYPALGGQYYRVVAWRGHAEREYAAPSASLPVNPTAPPVAWYNDNGGNNGRGTLSPFHTVHDQPVTVNVVPDDIDYDGGTVTIPANGFTQPDNGSVTLDPQSGAFAYTPAPNFVGTDTFTYWVTDGTINSEPATVAVDVTNAAPAPAAGAFDLVVDGTVPYGAVDYRAAVTGTVTAADADGDPVTYKVKDHPAHGTLQFNEQTGEFLYVAKASFNGADQFTFVAHDPLTPTTVDPADLVAADVKIVSHYQLTVPGGIDDTIQGEQIGLNSHIQSGYVEPITHPQHGSPVFGYSEGYIPDADYVGYDRLTYGRVNIGALQQRVATQLIRVSEPGSEGSTYWGDDAVVYYLASNSETTTYAPAATNWRPPFGGDVTLQLEWQASYGTVNFTDTNATGGFSYTPHVNPDTGEPYVGWDFFALYVTAPWGESFTQWVQLDVGAYNAREIALRALPSLPVQNARTFPATLEGLQQGYDSARLKLRAMLTGLGQLGQGVGQVAAASDSEILGTLDGTAPLIDTLAAQYQQYIDELAGLSRAAGKFIAAQWVISQADIDAVNNINKLPIGVGSLKASNEQMKSLAGALKDLGDGASIAVDTINKTVTYAENTHKVLSAVEMAGGVTVLVKTGATLLVKEGIKACAKAAAKEIVQSTASALGAELANYAAELAGVPQEYRQYITIGVDAYQAFSFLKAARAQVDPNGNCFVAGTQVIVGVNPDGTYVTKNIEEVEVGDTVLSRDQSDPTDDIEAKPVTRVFRKTSDHVRVLTIRDAGGNVETIRTTDEHPFWVDGTGWTAAMNLGRGDLMASLGGINATIVSSVRDITATDTTVYNLEVSGDHTYFVEDGSGTQSAIWAHNTCVGDKFFSTYKNKPVEFGHVKEVKFFKRDDDSYRIVYNEFRSSKRKNWIKKMGADDAAVTQLKSAGMTDDQIRKMRNDGVLPTEDWEVHHKHSIELGGGNDDDNLMIIRDVDAPFHSALTTAQNKIRDSLANVGDSVETKFPMFDGMVIFVR